MAQACCVRNVHDTLVRPFITLTNESMYIIGKSAGPVMRRMSLTNTMSLLLLLDAAGDGEAMDAAGDGEAVDAAGEGVAVNAAGEGEGEALDKTGEGEDTDAAALDVELAALEDAAALDSAPASLVALALLSAAAALESAASEASDGLLLLGEGDVDAASARPCGCTGNTTSRRAKASRSGLHLGIMSAVHTGRSGS